MKPAVPLMMGLAGMLANDPNFRKASIPSHKIEARKEVQQLSKTRIQKLKGKNARKNRGSNR